MILAASGSIVGQQAHAQTAPDAATQPNGGTANIGTVPITAPATTGGYASPSVSFGPFGDTPWQDVPFRTFSVPQQVIEDQQAHTPYEMLRNDPSVGIAFSPTFSPAGAYNIRGFPVDTTDIKLDGLPIWTGSAVNGFSVAPEGLERADVLTGAPAVLYGFAAPAGVINFVTKKPLDTPLTSVTLQYNSRLNFEEALDVSRRFGSNDQFGVRLNVAQQDGQGPVDHTAIDRNFFGLAMDWKPIDGMRIWVNGQENYRNTRGTDPLFALSSAFTAVPKAPDLSKLYGQPWYYNRAESLVGEGGIQFDDDVWHLAASAGETRTQLAQLYDSNGGTHLLPNETYTVTGYYNPNVVQDAISGNVQGSRKFNIGPVTDTVGLNYTYSRDVFADFGLEILNNLGTSSLLNPVVIPEPLFAITSKSETFKQILDTSAFLITDRIDIGTYVTVLAGADVATLDTSTVFTNPRSTSSEAQSAVTPLVALEVRPLPWLTGYFSYIQALEPGAAAPNTASNFGALLAPYTGDQYEIGVKADVNARLQLGADLFRIDQEFAIVDLDKIFKPDGTQRVQGVEFTVAGAVTDQLKLLGGVTILNAQVENPAVTLVSVTKIAGIPDFRLTLFGQYALRQVPGLALLAGVYFTGAQPVTQTLSVPAYATFDIGAKYDFVLNKVPVEASFYIQNLLNNTYWASGGTGGVGGSGQLQLGTPLQASMALTMRF